MTDDGCPLTPDPARWSDRQYRDNSGASPAETNAVIGRSLLGSLRPPSSHWDRLIAAIGLRARWRAVGEQLSRTND